MERLARLAHRIVWVNPRVGASAFSVRAGGMVAALPYCDALVSGHSFEALGEVVEAIGAQSLARRSPRRAPRRPSSDGRRRGAVGAARRRSPGSSVAMPSGYGPSKGNVTPGWVTDDGEGVADAMSDATKICIYPGCERPAVPAHPQGGPQPAFCDLEEHNALTAHQERQRLAARREPRARGDAVVANEAYRAVFLRVHPTGKMVLSLTTEADGKEPQYAQLVADELGVPALDVKVVPADTDRFGVGHGFNTSPSGGAPAAIAQRHREDPRQGAAARRAWRSRRRPRRSRGRTARGSAATAAIRRRSRPIADIALYAHGTGALPPGVEGGLDAQSVYTRLRRRAGGASSDDLDLVDDLERAEQRRVGLHAPVASA